MSDPARTIDITPEEEAKSVALALPDQARSVKVVDYATKEAANALFLQYRGARKVIADFYDPKIEKAKAAKKAADEARAALVAEKAEKEKPFIEAEDVINKEIIRFDEEDRARRERILREEEEQARKDAEAEALLAAEKAERAGDHEEAEAIIKEVVSTPIFVPPPPPPPKLAGSAEVTTWKFEVADLRALVLAVASGKAPLSYLQADEVAIRRTVIAQKDSFRCAGIKTWPETSRRSTGR